MQATVSIRIQTAADTPALFDGTSMYSSRVKTFFRLVNALVNVLLDGAADSNPADRKGRQYEPRGDKVYQADSTVRREHR